MIRSRKLPKDTNQRAAEIVRLATQEQEEQPTRTPIQEYLAQIGRKGGLVGGKARAESMSARRRKQIAQKAAQSRWAAKK